uniref:FHA domain-containing protein n=1 Tax=Anolis carolinensis TaxID=28377 RepID=A0A803TT18_ANOCA
MPLYGKIVVIKRNGADGTHFPLTASSCLFGRKKECDIRIQLPEVSKEHCKIEINENKEVILFNLSSTNPTQLNGNNVQDHTFLKHGDILTVIDRSFRFEYPPLSPRQKRSCRSQEKEMLQVLHVQQKEQDLLHPQDSENRNPKISDIKKSPQKCKNTKHLLTQRLGKRKRASFGVQLCPELLDERLPPNSPHKRNKIARRLSLPLQNSPRAVLKNDPGLRHSETKDQDQPNLMERAALPQGHGSPAALSVACRMSTKKTRSSFLRHMLTEECLIISTDSSSTDRIAHVQTLDASGNRDWPQEEEDKIKQPTTNNPIQDVETENNEPMSSNAFERGLENGVEVPAEAVLESNVSSPLTRKSGIKTSPQMPENTEHVLLTEPLGKRKRVSFGGQLSPELFDKRLPPNSPLKRGATPRRMTLPFGNSPRAVLKKGLGLRQSVTEVQHKTVLMKNASPKACRSPTTSPKTHAASSPTQKSPATSPKAPTTAFSTRRSPAATPIAHSSPSTSPAARKPPTPLPQRKGRFSISHVTCPSSEERDSITTQIHQNKEFDCVKTSESVGVVSQADSSVRRSKKFALKRSSMRRSSRMDSVHSKRRSGASEANLIVAKSWAEVVKQGVPKSQAKMTRTKCGVKKSPKKKPTKLSKNNVSTRRTPIRKAKGQFTSTGHANSPAPILIGKAHSSIMNLAAQVPKVMFNYPLKQHDLNESFTGMIEMFKTPLKGDEKRSLSSAQKTTSEVISEVHSPGKSGEASTKAFNVTNQHRLCNQDIVSPFSEKSQDACLGQDDLQIAPREANTRLEVTVRKNSLPVSVKETPALENKNPEIKSETMEEVSDVKKIIGTPKQKAETVEALSGVKRILRTPKEKPEPVEALSGVKRILRTPKDKPEPVEALSGVKRILRTPEQKTEPVEALSGIKRILRTPKEKSEPVEALSGIKRLLKTPEQKTEPVEVFSGVKRTSMQDLEPTKVFSGIRSLLRTPKENLSLVADDIVCSKLTKTPEVALPGSSEKEHTIQPMENHADEVPKEKVPPLEDLEEIQKQLRTPKQRPEVMQDLVGIGQLFKTPKQRVLPVDDFFGLPKLMAEPKQSSLSPEIDYTGVKDIFSAAHEHKDEILETASVEEDHGPSMNSRNNSDSLENELDERKGPNLEDLTEIKFPFTTESEEHTCDLKPKDNLLNELKTEATEMECIPKICQEDGTKSPKADKIIFLKKPALNLGSTDKEMAEPLVSGRRTRKRTYVESSTALKQKGKIQKLTRNSKTAKSDRYEKNNNSVQQSIPESSKLSIETDCNIQIKEIEPSKMESIGNKICLRYTRRKATPLKTENEILNTAITENKSGNTNYAASELYKTEALENNTEEFKENAIKGKGKKVHFLLEKNNSMSLEDKCVLGDNEGIPEEERSAFSKRSTSAKEKTSRRSKCKSSVVSQQLCFSPSEGKHTFETCRDKDKKGIQLSFESSNLTKEDPIVVSSGFSHGKNVQEIQAEERSNETQKLPLESIQEHPARRQKVARRNPPRNVCNKYKCLEQIQNETSLENISSKTVQTFKDNIPPRRQAEVKECFARKTCTEEVSKETAEKEHNLAGSIGDNRPKRGRAKKIVLREETASAEESHKTDSFISARRECSLKQTQNDANAYGTQGMPMENVEAPTEHSPSERFKIPKEDPPKRGKKKVIDQKTLAECEMKAAAVIKDENTVAKNVHSTKKSETKRGRGRKIASVSLLPPLEDNSLILSPSIKSKTAIEQGSGISETTATVDSGTLSHRGRRRKVDDINATNSAPILLDKDKEKKICKDLPEEKLSKRGRRKQLVLHETSTVNNSELGNSENTGLGKDKPMHLETGFEQKNQSKRKRGKQNVLASNELLPSLKVSITLPSSSEKDRTASENPSTFTESVGKNKRTKSDRKNEIVGCTTSLRRNKSTEEVFQEKDLEKKTLVNEKQCRRGRKKVTFEPEVCASLKEKAGITVSCAASEDQQEVLDNIAFSKKVPSCRRGQTFHKGKILQKDTDQINTSQNDQDNSSELLPQVAKKNPLRMGRRKEVKNVSETSTTILDVSEGFVAERRSTKSKKEKTENTTLKKGRKTKDSTAVTDPSETEGRTRGSRTRKRLL